MEAGQVELRGLTKDFDGVTAVDEIDLTIAGGEFFSLLGPSGCGKTTTLSMIAGFEHPTSGEILLDGNDLVRVPSHRRPVNTVFQNYALFPHLNVFDNVAFGLRRRREPRDEATRLTEDALKMVELDRLARRMPAQLSGGEQQRVALARALVLRPSVLLLDEPLGALDANIREQLRGELADLQREVGITFVFVTHDQEEALSLSQRIAVMNDGRIEQVGTPREIYESPQTAFVASFVGTANLMSVTAEGRAEDGCELQVGGFKLRATGGDTDARGEVKVVVRPERVEVGPDQSEVPANCLRGLVEETVYVGSNLQVTVGLTGGTRLQASIANTGDRMTVYRQGDPVLLHLPPDALRVLAGSGDDAVASPSPGSR